MTEDNKPKRKKLIRPLLGEYKTNKRRQVEALLNAGIPIRQIAIDLNMSTQNIYLYIKKYDLKGKKE